MKLHAGTLFSSFWILVYGILLLLLTSLTDSRGQEGYKKPPKSITDVLDAPPLPVVLLSPTRDRMLLVQGVNYPTIADLAEPMLRLAGLRINPRTNGPHRPPRWLGYTLQTIPHGKQINIKFPPHHPFLPLPPCSPHAKP